MLDQKINLMTNQITNEKIAQLQVACYYWGLARDKGLEACYRKAYAIFCKEMGADNSITLELRKEMTEFLSNQTATKAAVRSQSY